MGNCFRGVSGRVASVSAPTSSQHQCTNSLVRGVVVLAAEPHAVEKLAEWVDALVTIRSDGEPAVLQVAAVVTVARSVGFVATLYTSAPRDHAGHGLAERAVRLVGGMVGTQE